MAEDMLTDVHGLAKGDRNYWSPDLSEALRANELTLLAPFKKASREKNPWPKWLKDRRFRIETVIGQLVERFIVRRIWNRFDPDNIISRYANHMLIQMSGTKFILHFFQVHPPILFGSPEEIKAKLEKVKSVRAEWVCRIYIPLEKMPSFIRALQEKYQKYQIRTIDSKEK